MCHPSLTVGMCSLCYDTIHDGEHRTDLVGQKWDSHTWCHLMDLALVARKVANEARIKKGLPEID